MGRAQQIFLLVGQVPSALIPDRGANVGSDPPTREDKNIDDALCEVEVDLMQRCLIVGQPKSTHADSYSACCHAWTIRLHT